ncbi:cytochrome b/b6 domain-containing protein [Aurantiacibacter suaedae]|uniref:cytochrome b/b6 domain-containing protein n=1 Tax=Aurantiacibacter suaedae TaxID=2545755 RepID=UPI0010FA473B|nr:cytochrome b/b6 domain-containing protein [Aurantiacibacter suaedae]
MLGGAQQRYSGGAILLHWLLALLLAGELALGFTMPRDASGFELYQLHKSIGITILVLSLMRLGWRLTHKRPPKIEGGITGFLASAVHVGFYVLMIGVPLTGWAIVSTSAISVPTMIFGVVPWPHLPLDAGMNHTFEDAHEILAKVGIGLFVLHVVGALRHHFLMRDSLLGRMAPGGAAAATLGLMVAVIALWAAVYFGLGGGAGHDHEHEHEHEEDTRQEQDVTLPPDGSQAEGRVALDAESAAEQEPTEDQAAEGAEEPGDDEVATEDEPEAKETQASGPPPSWTIQPGGTLRFNVDNGGMALNGSFSRWSGTIAMDPEAPESARIAIEIDLASATLGDGTQDAMLKGPDFLGAGANPTATWRSTSVRRVSGNRYTADGTLRLKGVSRPQRIAFTLSGSGARRSVSGTAAIDRKAFSVGTGDAAEGVAPTVNVSFAFDATR